MSIQLLSVIIAFIILFSSLLSPAITSYFNSKYKLKMKKLELFKTRKREVLEGYLNTASLNIQTESPNKNFFILKIKFSYM